MERVYRNTSHPGPAGGSKWTTREEAISPKVRKADSRRRREREGAEGLWKAINPAGVESRGTGELLPALGG